MSNDECHVVRDVITPQDPHPIRQHVKAKQPNDLKIALFFLIEVGDGERWCATQV